MEPTKIPIDLNRLAVALEKDAYTLQEITQATNITPRIAGLHFLLRDIGCTTEQAKKAIACKEAKIQIKDRLIGMLTGWNENPIKDRGELVAQATRTTDWLFSNNLINIDLLIAAGPYYPSQPESLEK